VPSESEVDGNSASSHRRSSSRSSRSSGDHEFSQLGSDDEDDPEGPRGKVKSKSKRPIARSTKSDAGGSAPAQGGGVSFLTAAEQRAQDKKNDKKTGDDPFSFLKDVRDVSQTVERYRSVILTFSIRKTVINLATLSMTRGRCSYRRSRGRNLRHLKNR